MEVKLSRGLFARQRRERERRERLRGTVGINELLSNKSDTMNILAPYKLNAEISRTVSDKRRIPRACKTCVRSYQEDNSASDDRADLGIGNCFLIANRDKNHPLMKRQFAELYHFWNCGTQSLNFKLVHTNDVLNYPKFQESIRMINDSDATIEPECSQDSISPKDKGIVDEFIKQYGPIQAKQWLQLLWLRFGGWLLNKIFQKIFDGICYHKATAKLLKIATETGLPIIYIPLYRSSLDSYIFQWFLLTTQTAPLPFVIPPRLSIDAPYINQFASVMGRLGTGHVGKSPAGFYPQKTNLAAYAYIRLLLIKRNSLQFGLEPHRSRTGKASCFLTGGELLNIIVDMFRREELEDAFIVPLGINYEKLPEEDMLEFAQQESTQSFYNKTLSLMKLIRGYFGLVRIDMSEPFRLRDFKVRKPYSDFKSALSGNRALLIDSKSTTMVPGMELQWRQEVGSVASVSSIYAEPDPFYQVEVNSNDYYDDEDLLNALSQHIIYDAQKTPAIMCTNMVSFLLLKKFRNGVDLDTLVNEMDSLRKFIYQEKRDIGATGEMYPITLRAISILGTSLVTLKKANEIKVSPVLSTNSLIKLGYYANTVLQLYVKEACVSTAILSIMGSKHYAFTNTSISKSVSEDELIQSSLEVSQLIKGEFILNPPCESLETFVRRTIETLNDFNYIRILKKKSYTNGEDDADYSDDEFDDGTIRDCFSFRRSAVAVYVDKIEFITDETVWKYHEFRRDLIVPYLEFYKVGLMVLMTLVPRDDFNGEKEELELRQEIIKEVKQFMASSQVFKAEEVVTIETARNFLYHMTSMKIISSYSNSETKGKRLYFLTEEYSTNEKLEQLLFTFKTYITYSS